MMKLTQEQAGSVHYRGRFSSVDFIVGYHIIRLRTKCVRIATYVHTYIVIPKGIGKPHCCEQMPVLSFQLPTADLQSN